MKIIATVVLACSWTLAQADSAGESLEPVAKRALAEGRDFKLNIGFAQVLGLKADKPLPFKQLRIENHNTSNRLNVNKDNPTIIILQETRGPLSTYYLTDPSGKLKKAVVNDSTVIDGGLTNLPLTAVASSFEKQKLLWLQSQTK
jgi:hypothetical protein